MPTAFEGRILKLLRLWNSWEFSRTIGRIIVKYKLKLTLLHWNCNICGLFYTNLISKYVIDDVVLLQWLRCQDEGLHEPARQRDILNPWKATNKSMNPFKAKGSWLSRGNSHLNIDKIEFNLCVPVIQGYHENALIRSCETSRHLTCLYPCIQIPLGSASGSGLDSGWP